MKFRFCRGILDMSGLDCKQSLFCSKNPAGGAARKRVRYLSREPRAASREPRARIRRSPLEYRARGFAVRPARIFEQKRDCSQSMSGQELLNNTTHI